MVRAEQILFEKAHISHFHVFPIKNSANTWEHNQLVGVSVDGIWACTCTIGQLGNIFGMLRNSTSIHPLACHLHHLLGSSFIGVDFLIRTLRPPILRFYIHDYYSLCPQFNLLKEGVYCGAPPLGSAECAGCSSGLERSSHVYAFRDLFIQHRFEYIAPSDVAAEIWKKTTLYPGSHIRVIPHLEVYLSEYEVPTPVSDERKIRIAYVGYQSDLKGWQFWKRIASLVDRDEYSLFHIGAGEEEVPGVIHQSLPVEKGLEDPVGDTIRKLGIDIVVLWSIWPETFSFTLFESMAGRCFVLTSASSGNIAEVVRERSAGLVFPDESGALSFLANPPAVRDTIRSFRNTHPRMEIQWNPELASESVRTIAGPPLLSMIHYDEILADPLNRPFLFRLESELRADRQLQETCSQLQQAKEEIAVVNRHNQELEIVIGDLRHDLEVIRSGILWKLMTRFHNVFIERGLPQGTGRRRLYDRYLLSARAFLNKKVPGK